MRRTSLLLAVLLVSVGTAAAAESINVTITESGRITSYFNQYWVVNVDGNISVTNPTARDLFDVELRFDLGSLSIVESSGNAYLQGSSMLISRIRANSSVTTSYNIVGISLYDPALIDKGVLYSAMTALSPVVYSDTFGQLQKASLENESLTGRPGRLVSVTLNNPTGFQFTVNSLKVIKTPSLDPNSVLDTWYLVNDTAPLTLDPDNYFVRDILDLDSAEGMVYWLVADVFISRVSFYDLSNVTRYTQENLTIPPELLNYTANETNASERDPKSARELYVKKIADRQVVTLDTPVKLSLIINNFAEKIIDFTVTEELPPGFVLHAGEGWTEKGGYLVYTGRVSGKAVVIPSYTATLTDRDTAGFDYFASAKVDYTVDTGGKTAYSDRVPFIRQYLPNQKIYVQKKLVYRGEDEVEVTVTVQNLGSGTLTNLLLKEYLEDADVFSQISQLPSEKGLWSIPELKPGGSWEVTYVTTTDTKTSILPGLYGVPSSDVLKSLVLESVIASGWEVMKQASLEIVGIGLLLGLPVVYYFMRRKPPTFPPSAAPPVQETPPASPPVA